MVFIFLSSKTWWPVHNLLWKGTQKWIFFLNCSIHTWFGSCVNSSQWHPRRPCKQCLCPSGPGTRCAQLCFAGQWRGWRGDKVGLQPRKGSSRWDPASELSWYCFKPCVQKHGATVVLLHHPRFRLARSNVCLRAQQSPILNTATTRCSDFISSSSDIWRTWHQSCSQRRPCEDAFTPLSSPPVQELSAAAPRDHRSPKRVPGRESLADLKSNLQCN